MKKLLGISVFIIAIISFTGCYSRRAVVVERPPVARVMVAPPPYYYRPAPVIVESYRSAPYYTRKGRHAYRRYRY